MDLSWLDDQLLGEPVRDWLTALAIAAAVLLVLALVKRIVLGRIGRIAARTETHADDFLVEMVRRTKWLLVLFPVLSLAAVSLDLPRLQGYLKTAAVLAFLLQLALWTLVGINFWMERKRRTEADAASATMIRAFGFMGKFVLWSVILLLALDNLGVDVTALIAGLGVGGVAVALAVQNILGDLLASLSIVLDKPFVIGDTIQVDNFTGTVESIGIKTTHLRSVTGEQLVFANGDLVKSRIRNQKRMAERRVAHTFDVVYPTPAQKLARIPEILRKLVDERADLRFDHAHLVGLSENGVRFEAVWFVLSADNNLHLNLQQEVLLELLRRFEAEGIELAHPTRTLIDQRSERSLRA